MLKFLTHSKAFFRRAVIDNSFKNFVCFASRGCVIDSKSWRSCKFCRFEKCLSSGLKPSWVLDKSERKRRHLRTMTSTASTTSVRCSFHQHITRQLLHKKFPKVQKDSQVISVFCSFGIDTSKSCT